jgi:Calcineurin-like phosphoesterase
MTSILRSRVARLLAVAGVVAVAGPGLAAGAAPGTQPKPVTIAVIGDVPYGEDQEARFGELVDAINDDHGVDLAAHLGDIKSGSTTCTDERFQAVADHFADVRDPLVYTIGDNEWTDCHRVNNGAFNPLERLAKIRELFFPRPGRTLGKHRMHVDDQPSLAENVSFVDADVVFATVHVIGSNNGLAPWSGLGFTAPTPEQAAEVDARIAADLAWIDAAFDQAESQDLAGVVLAMQADTWAPAPGSAQQAIVDRIAARTAAFDGQVLVLQGDTHVFKVDDPLGLPNFTRIVVHGETLPFEYLRLTVDPWADALFSWERVAVGAAA